MSSGDDEPKIVGKGWTAVAVSKAGTGSPDASGELGALLEQLPREKGDWGSGRVLSGTAFSVVLTDDGRMAVGAVEPELLYAALEGVTTATAGASDRRDSYADDHRRRGSRRRWSPVV